jgi:NADPH-dependent 2,4-dienoyl-CoA reductase/sulfur reductase-like enzyme
MQVVVIGAGFGGATAAKYLRRFNPALAVTIIEPADRLVMCPLSNRVVNGSMVLSDISRPYDRFATQQGVRWVRSRVDDIDTDKREVRMGRDRLPYDRLIFAPGVEFDYSQLPGLGDAAAQARVPHAWKAGPQTVALRDMLRAMRDGGTVAIHIPKAPFRCPPGPYERASLIAHYLQLQKPRSKLLVYDANPQIQSKKGLFEAAWRNRYSGLLEYVPDVEIQRVDAGKLKLDLGVHGSQAVDVLNVIPPQSAPALARRAGLMQDGERWCPVDFLSYESSRQKGVHVIGDAIAGAPGMPKSAHMANQEAKVCAAAVAAQSLGQPVPTQPIIANTCYSFISHNEAIHVAAVYRWDAAKRTMVAAPDAGGMSEAPSASEGVYAIGWASNILADTLD